MRQVFIRFFLLTLILGPLAGGAFQTPGDREKIPIAAIFALSGRGRSSNIRHLRGAILADEELNRQGGVLGRGLDLKIYDNESSSLMAARRTEEAIRDGAKAIIGASWSAHSLAMAPVAQAAGIPMVTNYSTNPKLTEIGDFIFRTCYKDNFQARVMARFARHNLKLTKVAVLYESGNDYSTDLATLFEGELKKLGGKVVFREAYLKDSLDYSEIIQSVVDREAQAVYLPGFEKETGLIIKQAYKKGLKLPFLGSDSWGSALPDYLGEPIQEGYEVQAWSPESPGEASRQFVKRYRRRFPSEREVSSGAALAYDAVMLVADAMRRGQSAEPGVVRNFLAQTTRFVGVTGPIRFDSRGDPIKAAVINRYHQSVRPEYFTTIGP